MNLEGVAEPPGGIFLVPWVRPVARGLGGSAAGWGLLVGVMGFWGASIAPLRINSVGAQRLRPLVFALLLGRDRVG
ncbi:MAG: hypothetical protein EA366_12385 [Spirulina sp. DLM2.Bin59]|nr:MAG: hypothetical protein EA366_12385 [Spirulina sp. DLM2.Bin59]